MKALVTGATGFIGSHMVRRLVKEGLDTHVFLRPSSNTWRIRDTLSHVTAHDVDITDQTSVARSLRSIAPDYIYHFANAGLYGGHSEDTERLYAVNTDGLKHLLTASGGNYRAFVNVGTSSEYGRKRAPMREDDACEPANPYGKSKLAATHVAAQEGRRGNSIATFRLFSPFGPYDDSRRLIVQTILGCIRKTPFRLPHVNAVRDYIYVDNVVDLLYEVRESIGAHKGEVFNVGRGEEVHAVDIVMRIADMMDARAYVGSLSTSAKEAAYESSRWQADMTKTFASFPWRPSHTLDEGLEKTVAWFKENAGLYD